MNMSYSALFRWVLGSAFILLASSASACTVDNPDVQAVDTPSAQVAQADNNQDTQMLSLQVFNPGPESLFPVTSTLIEGPTEAVLIDAQFQRNDAQTVLDIIQASGKTLTTIYISHGDPDFYFGLDVIKAAYPDVQILASPATVSKIQETIQLKMDFWGPILGENAPRELIIPDVLEGDVLTVDGEFVEIIGLDGHDPAHTFAWIPSLKTVAGGVVVYENLHVWIADNQTPESRDSWSQTLDSLLALNPERIIPGHFIGTSSENTESVEFTRAYFRLFEREAEQASDSAELIAAMQGHYPDFENVSDLELSAQVIMGEVEWP